MISSNKMRISAKNNNIADIIPHNINATKRDIIKSTITKQAIVPKR